MIGKGGERLPDFLIVGAAKAGTTSLYYYLKQHPRIVLPKQKEPNYFALAQAPWAAGYGEHSFGGDTKVTEYGRYCSLFSEVKDEQIAGEASIIYLPLYRETVQQIYSDYLEPSEVKILIMLRDPVDRAVSHYLMNRKSGDEPLSFYDATRIDTIERRIQTGYQITWDYLRLGLYAEGVSYYLEKFKNVKIIDFHRFVENTSEVMREVLEFLGVESMEKINLANAYNRSGASKPGVFGVLNKFVYTQNPVKAVLAKLVPDLFKPHILSKYSKFAFEKWTPEKGIQQELRSYYRSDQKQLATYFARRQVRL